MNPNELEILLHHYVTPSPSRHPRFGGISVQEATNAFVGEGMLRQYPAESPSDSERYTITEKGICYMEMVLNTPRPILVWINPMTNEQVLFDKDKYRYHDLGPFISG